VRSLLGLHTIRFQWVRSVPRHFGPGSEVSGKPTHWQCWSWNITLTLTL